MADKDDSSKERLIDTAIADCRINITRHFLSSLFELLFVLGFILIIGMALLKLAEMQGAENDQKRLTLSENLKTQERAIQAARSDVNQIHFRISAMQSAVTPAQLAESVGGVTSLTFKTDAEFQERKKALLDTYDKKRQMTIKELESAEAGYQASKKMLEEYKAPVLLPETTLYGAAAVLVILIAVFTGLYRFHLKEMAKNEQYRAGFHRIRIAANNASIAGFEGEVRTALTKGAFDPPPAAGDPLSLRKSKIESPLPGHPTSDLTTALLNRLLDGVDIVLQPKGTGK